MNIFRTLKAFIPTSLFATGAASLTFTPDKTNAFKHILAILTQLLRLAHGSLVMYPMAQLGILSITLWNIASVVLTLVGLELLEHHCPFFIATLL